MSRTDIAVIGGGLAGLMTARQLAATGKSVTLIAPERKPDRRTTALLGGSIEALKAAGIWPEVSKVAQRLRAIRIVDATHRLVRAPEVLFEASELGLPAFGYNIPNESLLAALEASARAAGVSVLTGTAVDIQRGPATAAVSVSDGRDVEAELVVACDGRGSPTRASAGIGVRTSDGGQSAIVCDFAHQFPHDDVSTEFHTEYGPFTIVPLPEMRSALVWVTETPEANRILALPITEVVRLMEQNTRSMLGGIEIVSALQAFPLQSMIADRLSAERLVLVGEAAHALPPIGAQGFNLTIRDIECLVDLIKAGDDSGAASVTSAYDRKRRADIAIRRRAVDLVNLSLLSEALPVQLARGAGLFALSRVGPLRRTMMRLGLDLDA